jgi:hypothetical protein
MPSPMHYVTSVIMLVALHSPTTESTLVYSLHIALCIPHPNPDVLYDGHGCLLLFLPSSGGVLGVV